MIVILLMFLYEQWDENQDNFFRDLLPFLLSALLLALQFYLWSWPLEKLMLTLSMSNAHITSLASRDANDMILYFSAHLGQSEIYTGIIYINFYIRHHDFCLWIKHCDKYRLYLRREFSSGKTKKATSINSWFFLLDKYVFHHLGKWQERISWIFIL